MAKGITSIVERRATKLADSVILREMERITKAIADTYARAKEECRMAEVLNVDRATFHRYRSGFVYGVAERLGWY